MKASSIIACYVPGPVLDAEKKILLIGPKHNFVKIILFDPNKHHNIDIFIAAIIFRGLI